MRWSEVIDFSKLLSLIIHSQVGTETLSWLMKSCRFDTLEALALDFDSGESEEFIDQSSKEIDALILSLRPLKI